MFTKAGSAEFMQVLAEEGKTCLPKVLPPPRRTRREDLTGG